MPRKKKSNDVSSKKGKGKKEMSKKAKEDFTKDISLDEDDVSSMTTFRRKGEGMTPPKGTSSVLRRKILPLLTSEFDSYLRSEEGISKLRHLRVKSDLTEPFELHSSFPSLNQLDSLLDFLPTSFDSGGSDFSHWIVFNLTFSACLRVLRKPPPSDIKKWSSVEEELRDPTHWYQFLMALVLYQRYEFAKHCFLSAWEERDVSSYLEKLDSEIQKTGKLIRSLVHEGEEEEVVSLREGIKIMERNKKAARLQL